MGLRARHGDARDHGPHHRAAGPWSEDLDALERPPTRSKAPLIGAALALAALVGWWLMPTPAVTVVDCGDVSQRPEGGGPVWTHDSWCTLKGVVQRARI